MSPTGSISGRHLNEFLANPTLHETLNINSNCFFKSIQVEGPVFIRQTLNDVNLDDLLGDVVYKHEPKPEITSFKTFDSIKASNIQIKSNLLNDIPLDAYVTKNTEQEFSVDHIDGDVFIDRLNIDGLVDFINVTELDMNAIKLFGEQFTDAELIFEGNDTIINASQIVVRETINDIDVNNFIDINSGFEVYGDITLDTLLVNNCTVNGDVVGDDLMVTVNGFSLTKLRDSHLSRSDPQEIVEAVVFDKVVVRNGFDADKINGFDYKQAVDVLQRLENIDEMLSGSTVRVHNMTIHGNVHFTGINGFDFDYIAKNAIRLDEENTIPWPIVFHDSVHVDGNLTIDKLNGVNFTDFVNKIVKRDDPQINIGGSTVFRGKVRVFGGINTENINGFRPNQILTRQFRDPILNPIEIFGDVTLRQLIVDGHFNNVSKEQIESYNFDEQHGVHILRRNIEFNEPLNIEYLQLNAFGNVDNVNEFIQSVVRIDRPVNITGTKYFTGRLHFNNDIHISHYEDIDVQEFLSNIILIDRSEPIVFERDVILNASISARMLHVYGDLVVKEINNNTLTDWLEKSIRTDMPFFHNGTMIFGDGTFEANNVHTERLNGLRVDKILTLNTPQSFSESIHFDVVESLVPITTDGLVSGYDLKAEEANTLKVRVFLENHRHFCHRFI